MSMTRMHGAVVERTSLVTSDQAWLCVAILLGVLANASGLFIPVLEPDSANQAVIAKTMAQNHDFVNLFFRNDDWLDKPHLPFWISAASFSLLGFSAWAYKLPALILILATAVYTYAFAKALYGPRVAVVAAIMLLTAQHIIIASSDVRSEPYMLPFIIGAVYHFYRTSTGRGNWHLVIGSLLAAAAVMSKGIFALIPIGGAIAGGFFLAGQWRAVAHPRWLVAALLVLIFIGPELYCLWQQFDAHPEKAKFGQTGVSGVRFFLWDSQFGRFFNTGPIRGAGNPFQYLVVIVWAFLPWSVPFYVATYEAIRARIAGNAQAVEYFNLSGALVTFLLFSASQFQLPHYIIIAFPFFAIVTAAYLLGLSTQTARRWVERWQWLYVGLAFIVCVALQVLFRPHALFFSAVLLAATFAVALYLHIKSSPEQWQTRVIVTLACVSAAVNLYLNSAIVPDILTYQAGGNVATYANAHYPGQPVVQTQESFSSAFAFYVQAPTRAINASTLPDLPQGTLVYASPKVLQPFADRIQILHRAPHYPITKLRLNFLNPATRSQVTDEYWLVQMNGQK